MTNQDELDGRIGEWSIKHDAYDAMNILQKAGVPAGAVTDAQHLDEEPHLRERGFWKEIDRAVVGRHPYSTFPVQFSEMEMDYRPAPTLGQDNDYVLGTILGLSKNEIEKLKEERIIGTEPLQTGLGI